MEELLALLVISFLAGLYFWQTIDMAHTAKKWEKEDKKEESKDTPKKYS